MRLIAAPFIALAALVGSLAWSAPSEAADGYCGVGYARTPSCSWGAVGGGEVQIHAATVEEPSVTSGATRAGTHEEDQNPAPNRPVVQHPVPRRDRLAADVDSPCRPGVGLCADGQHAFLPPARTPTKPADPAPAVPAAPAVTLADVAQFVPRDASIRSQPNGWAIVGAPVNLFTDAAPQVVDGQLLGRPAQVRFVPVAFAWDHGDDTSSTVAGPGASWRELGQQDFTATDTSHVYSSIGDRQVTLTISYSPSYRFDGGGWQQIPGTLPVQVGPVTIHVVQGSTVLVAGACGERHAGPGC
jgi:hypothetical protein